MTRVRALVRWTVTVVLVITVLVALAAATLLADARLGDVVRRREIELVSFTHLGLPLALGGLLAAGLLGARHGRVVLLVAAAPCLLLASVHAWWLSPLYVGPVPAAADGPRLVVMTQNFEYGDARELVELVSRHEVDVLVLTDAPMDRVVAVREAGVEQDLPHTTADDRTGSVVWSRFPITGTEHISGGGDSRVVTLDVPDVGRVDLVALHPTPPYQEQGGRWTEDWSRILDRLAGAYGPTAVGNVVLAGDLNATLDHPPVRSLVSLGFRDVGEQLNGGRHPTWPTNDMERRWGVAVPTLFDLDHVLTTRSWVPTALVLSDAVGSDHRAVIATLAPAG